MEAINFQNILSTYGVYSGTYVVCLISGFIPIVNAELFLIFVSSLIDRTRFLPVLLLATIGQMTAKTVLYYSGMGILKLSSKRYENKINDTIIRMQKWGSKIDIFIFLSAFTGFPPFYLISIVTGTMRHNILRFLIAGFAGRFLRFGLVMLFPQIFKQIFL